jgi:site-specific DNA-adenine methylase
MKIYSQAPLPFMGQKRRWIAEFKRTLPVFDDCYIFVDLFGGSGLLSRAAKDVRPDARVVYNDYDDYHVRIENISRTNDLLSRIRALVGDYPKNKMIKGKLRTDILDVIEKETKAGFVDFITLSSGLLFSMNYATDFESFAKQGLYNTLKLSDYDASGYLEGLEIVKQDYRDLYIEFLDHPAVCYFVDPPYLSTETTAYMMSWRLGCYLDVLKVLKGSNYFYFTSNKSSIIELCDWLGKNAGFEDPFKGATMKTVTSHMNYAAKYTDIMLYKRKF